MSYVSSTQQSNIETKKDKDPTHYPNGGGDAAVLACFTSALPLVSSIVALHSDNNVHLNHPMTHTQLHPPLP